jgi:PAS domain S-box-containing protein
MEHKPTNTKESSERTVRLANLLMLSYEPMLAWRLDGPIEFWNAGVERLYGYPANEAVGRISHALLQTKFPIELPQLISQIHNEGYCGEVIVDSRMQLLTDGSVLEVNRDVTNAKVLTARQVALVGDLSAAAAKFEAVFNQSGIFAGIMDLKGYLREVNNLAVDLCGYTREEVLDRPFWATLWWRGSEDVKAKIRLATDQALSGSVFREELRYWLADGSPRIVDFAIHPILGGREQ